MNPIFKKIARMYYGLQSAWSFGWRCFLVVIRSQFGKITRDETTHYLHKGAKKILKSVKANYKISFAADFKLIDNAPRIYMSNHLSLFDTPLFYATILDTIRIVTKQELASVPLIGKAILNSEHALVNRQKPGQNQDFFADAKKKLLNGIALWIFPEGTRSRDGKLLPFRSGGFRLAAEVGAQIIPVGIIGTDKILPADKLLPHLNQNIEIRLGMPIFAGKFDTPDLQKILLNEVDQAIRDLIKTDGQPIENITNYNQITLSENNFFYTE